MPATITDLAHWRATHPPLLRLWQAHCRLAAAWVELSCKLVTVTITAAKRQ